MRCSLAWCALVRRALVWRLVLFHLLLLSGVLLLDLLRLLSVALFHLLLLSLVVVLRRLLMILLLLLLQSLVILRLLGRQFVLLLLIFLVGGRVAGIWRCEHVSRAGVRWRESLLACFSFAAGGALYSPPACFAATTPVLKSPAWQWLRWAAYHGSLRHVTQGYCVPPARAAFAPLRDQHGAPSRSTLAAPWDSLLPPRSTVVTDVSQRHISDSSVVGVVNDGGIYVSDVGVVGEVPAFPPSALITTPP